MIFVRQGESGFGISINFFRPCKIMNTALACYGCLEMVFRELEQPRMTRLISFIFTVD